MIRLMVRMSGRCVRPITTHRGGFSGPPIIHTHTHTQTHTPSHPHTPSHTHSHTHTNIHTHLTHTHTQTCKTLQTIIINRVMTQIQMRQTSDHPQSPSPSARNQSAVDHTEAVENVLVANGLHDCFSSRVLYQRIGVQLKDLGMGWGGLIGRVDRVG